MKAALILALTLCQIGAATNEIRLPALTIGTNRYADVVLLLRNPSEGVIRYRGGIRKVKLSELPEPIRGRVYDANAEAKFIAANKPKPAPALEPLPEIKVEPDSEVEAYVRFNAVEVHIRNMNNNAWNGVTLVLDGKYVFEHQRRCRPYEEIEVPLLLFVDKNGKRFQPLEVKPKNIVVKVGGLKDSAYLTQ